MTELSLEQQQQQQWKKHHEGSDSLLWEGDMREDKALPPPRQNARRKSAPKNVNRELQHHHKGSSPSPPPVREKRVTKSPKVRRSRRDLVRNRRDLVRNRPRRSSNDNVTIAASTLVSTSASTTNDTHAVTAFHASSPEEPSRRGHSPLHHFVHPPSPDSDSHNRSLRESLKEGRRQLLHILNKSKEGTAYKHHNVPKGLNKGKASAGGGGPDTDDVTTASTSGSHSSSSTNLEGCPLPTAHNHDLDYGTADGAGCGSPIGCAGTSV